MYEEAAQRIILEQEGIMGPIARDVASQVGAVFSANGKSVKFSRDPKKVIADLISAYGEVFGQASLAVSNEAVKKSKFR